MASHIFCGMSELDYSPTKLVQNQIDYAYTTSLTPHNSIISGNNIIFHIEGGTDFVDLSNTFLTVDIRVSKSDGTEITNVIEVAPVNNIFHTIFSQVQVKLKDTVISHPSPNYSYRAYLENLLNFSSDAKNSWMKNQGWYFDEADKFELVDNPSFAARRELIVENRLHRLKGRLSTDISAQPLLIPSQTDINFTLTPQKAQFALLRLGETDTSTYKIEIVSAELSVRKVKLFPDAVNDFEESIAKQPISLPISQVRVTTVSIAKGLTTFNQNSLFHGVVPNYLVIGFVNNSAYAGSWNKNPFFFDHFNLNHIQLKVNERLVPTVAFTPSFAKKQVIDVYESIFAVVGRQNQDWSSGIQIKDFCGGSALYGFVLNNDSLCRHDSQNILGHVDISVNFSSELLKTVTMVVYSSTQGNVIIDQYRNILLDV